MNWFWKACEGACRNWLFGLFASSSGESCFTILISFAGWYSQLHVTRSIYVQRDRCKWQHHKVWSSLWYLVSRLYPLPNGVWKNSIFRIQNFLGEIQSYNRSEPWNYIWTSFQSMASGPYEEMSCVGSESKMEDPSVASASFFSSPNPTSNFISRPEL